MGEILCVKASCKEYQYQEKIINKLTIIEKIYIIKAENAGDLCVCLYFNDDTTQTVNIGEFIRNHPHPQYNKYLDPRKFSRFTIENGNIVWGKNWDLVFPIEQLHAGKITI